MEEDEFSLKKAMFGSGLETRVCGSRREMDLLILAIILIFKRMMFALFILMTKVVSGWGLITRGYIFGIKVTLFNPLRTKNIMLWQSGQFLKTVTAVFGSVPAPA